MATIQELQEQLAAAEAALAEKDAEIRNQAAQLQAHDAKDIGWLIIAPNPLYDGEVLGIPFRAGLAFIPANQRVPAVEIEPMKESQLAAYPEEERAAIRKREAIPTAERAARRLATDFGYAVEFFDLSRKSERESIMAERQEQRKLAELSVQEAAKIAKLSIGG